MKKTVMSLLLMLCLFGSAASTVHAETFYGDETWQVAFTSDNKMVSSFRSSDLDDKIYGLQPGDNVIITLKLKNENSTGTDWYMTNKVLYSLEDRSANSKTKGGAYTYKLSYTDKNGTQYMLYDSDTVGGEYTGRATGDQGLHEATNALDEYFYLDTLSKGQSGKITLEVALDGETQGNDYQDTLADLQMNFGVELNSGSPSDTSSSSSRNRHRTRTSSSENSVIDDLPVPLATVVSERDLVRTGDETDLVPLYIVMGISGGLFLYLAFYGLKRNKEEEEEKKGGLTT